MFWEDVFDELLDLIPGGVGPSAIRSQFDEARHREFFETIKSLFLDDAESKSREILRAVVESGCWFVPVSEDGTLVLSEIPAKRYRQAIETDAQLNSKERRKKGKGGRFLKIYDADPTKTQYPNQEQDHRKFIRMDGCELVRAIPGNTDGLLLHAANNSPAELGSEYFEDLSSVVAAFDLEELLVCPAPGQVEKLKQATWQVRVTASGDTHFERTSEEGWLAEACTHRDRVNTFFSHEYVEMKGEELFRRLCENADIDGLLINPTSKTGRGEAKLHRMVMHVSEAAGILYGDDVRLGTHALKARSLDEIELWLKTRRFPAKGRKLLDKTKDGVRYVVAIADESEWRMQESFSGQFRTKGITTSPVFEISDLEPDAPSRILCPGLLARELNADSFLAKDAKQYWNVGKNYLIGTHIGEYDREESRKRLVVARELAKFLPAGADRIPRRAIRTVGGAAILRKAEHGGTRQWIQDTIERAARGTQSWVWLKI